MKLRVFVWSMLIVIMASLMTAWLLITPPLDARGDSTTALSLGKPNPTSEFKQLALTPRLDRTIDITVTPAYTAYLPVVLNVFPPPPAGIYGQVTYQGVPSDGLQIQLWLCNRSGSVWNCSETYDTTTQWGGRYQFINAASLGSNQKYIVVFQNTAFDSRFLYSWYSFSLPTYTAGQTLWGGDFDVANMVLLSPPDTANVGLPVTFEWQPRVGVPLDNYTFMIHGRGGSSALFQTSKLGYVGSYTLTNLPLGFTTGTQYIWLVSIYGSGDSTGSPLVTRYVTFH